MTVTVSKTEQDVDFELASQVPEKPVSINSMTGDQVTEAEQRNTKVKSTELILFTTQLSVMLDSGVVLSDALDAISSQSEQGNMRSLIENISEVVKGGENFSRALSAYPKVFNTMFISMVRASEASGKMAEMLTVLSGYLDFEAQTRKEVKGALTYPLIMMVMAIGATVTLITFVLPRFIKIYEAREAALPALTRMMVSCSNFLNDLQSMTITLTILTFLTIAFCTWAATIKGRRIIDMIKIRMPVLGTMFIDMSITRSMRIMATMINTGVNLLDTIEVIKEAVDNSQYKSLWADTNLKIRNGYQLSEAMQLSKQKILIPSGIIQMIRAGEKSGRLGLVSEKISTFYEKKLQASIKTVTTMIEPLMITVIGGIIGIIAIALLLPVFKISTIVAR